MNETRRALLSALETGPVGGPTLADRLGISRAAVWKQVEALREVGFEIDSTPAGYVVRAVPAYGAAAIEFGLSVPYRIEYHESLGSTNDRARELAADGERDVVIVADEQTGGRGRRDRSWTAPSGGIWCSTVCEPALPPAHMPVVTLAAGVAAVRACRSTGVAAHLKWPNDVLVGDRVDDGAHDERSGHGASRDDDADRGGRKLAGILTEMEGEADRVSWVLIGIGINANVDPAALPPGATSLRAEVGEVDRRAVLQTLLSELTDLLDDPDGVLEAWREHATTLGRRVRVETARETVVGRAIDVRFPGALVIETDDGEHVVHAGDCEHLRAV